MHNKKILLFVMVLVMGLLLVSGCSNDSTNDEPEIISFKDDFSDESSGWKVETKEDVSRKYVDGKYQIKALKANHLYWAHAPIDKLGSEYTVQADMLLVEGEIGRYGFIFNYVSKEDYYVFRVNPVSQYYNVVRKHNGTWSDVIDWTEDAENINNINNNLKLIQNGDKLEVYINEVKVADTSIVKHSEGIWVGLLVSTLDDESYLPVTVQFDNFEVHGYAYK